MAKSNFGKEESVGVGWVRDKKLRDIVSVKRQMPLKCLLALAQGRAKVKNIVSKLHWKVGWIL